MIGFFKRRLPQYECTTTFCKVTVLLLTATAAILGFFGFAQYAAVLTSTAAGIHNLLDYFCPVAKMARYNRAVNVLESTLSWWNSLTPIRQSIESNAAHLIDTAEQVMMEELLSWSSAGVSNKLVTEDNDDKGEGDKVGELPNKKHTKKE